MKVIAYEFGQVLQMIRLEEMRPKSGVYVPDLIRAIRERYRFVNGPDTNLLPPNEGLKFETGTLTSAGRQIAIKSIGIYTDGLVVACWNTDDADFITDEFIQWGVNTFHFRPPQANIRRRHASNLVVDFDAPINCLMSSFSRIKAIFQSALDDDQGVRIDAHLQRISLGPDQQSSTTSTQNNFLLEQRAGTTFEEKRYYSGVSMTTSAHIRLLSEIEKLAVEGC